MELRIKMSENFKDGNVLGGKFLAANKEYIVSKMDADKIANSGGLFEVIEQVIPNPLKHLVVTPEEQADPKPNAELSSYIEEEPAKGKAKPGQTVIKPRKGGKKK